MYPKGKLILLGQLIDTQYNDNGELVVKQNHGRSLFSCISLKKEAHIEIITSLPSSDESLKVCCDTISEKGHTNYGIISMHKECNYNNGYYSRIVEADLIILLGNQSEIHTFLSKNSIGELLHNKYMTDEKFILIGIHTAAMALSDEMISKKCTEKGLGFVKECVIYTPTEEQPDYKKLIKSILTQRNYLGLSIRGGMSVIIEKGYQAVCKGKGSAMIINARAVTAKSMKPFIRGASIYVKNLKGQILVDGSAVDLRTGTLIKPRAFSYDLNFTKRNNPV